MDHYISAMVSMVYEDRAKSTQGLEMPEEFWDALVMLVQEGKIVTFYDDNDGEIKYQTNPEG
jgi:hypothetical protein